jgi:hypothetical protein
MKFFQAYILARSRIRECTEEDIHEICNLVLTNPNCDRPDFRLEPWNNAILITPHHCIIDPWNRSALLKHSIQSRQHVFVCPAEDTTVDEDLPLTMEQRVLVAGMNKKTTGNLAEHVELAIGMKAMVLQNIATEADLTNGTRGQVAEIVLDSREDQMQRDDETGFTHLRYPPAMVMFKPDKACLTRFDGVPNGLIPIFPTTQKFNIKQQGEAPTRLKRRQLAIVASYAFTDYKSQGQTIEQVIIDLAKPPTGSLSPFSAYVALSRNRGRKSIRLLRDFDDELFTKHPSEMLRDEDERLEGCDAATRLRFVL